jgi:hypothetical protein
MLTYVFNVEIISFNPLDETGQIDVDHDTYDIEAVDEQSAIATLKERFNYVGEFIVSGVNNFRLIGTIEDETF